MNIILTKIKFETDYQEGAHPKILERLIQTNLEQTSGYGIDYHCEKSKKVNAGSNGKTKFQNILHDWRNSG